MYKFIIAAATLAVVAGCSSTPPTPAPVEERPAATTGSGAGGASTTGANTGSVAGQPAGGSTVASVLKDQRSALSKRSVYFAFDSFDVKDDFRPLIEAHAKYLAANKASRMTIQGNADERGSREYNIALGQKRADAVKGVMLLLGATEAQIETVSFGKEKPRKEGHDEASWAENRRDDMIYAGE